MEFIVLLNFVGIHFYLRELLEFGSTGCDGAAGLVWAPEVLPVDDSRATELLRVGNRGPALADLQLLALMFYLVDVVTQDALVLVVRVLVEDG